MIGGGGMGFPPGGDPGGPRRGRWFGDHGILSGSRSTRVLLGVLALTATVLLISLL